MLLLINILVLFFTILLIYQVFINEKLIEGLDNQNTYQSYDTNNSDNALILAQQNAGNIQVLKQQLDSLTLLPQQFQDLSHNFDKLQEEVDQINAAQADYVSKMNDTQNITGLDDNKPDTTINS